MIFHVTGLRAAICFKPGWADALIAAGTVTGDMLTIPQSGYDDVLSRFGGNPMLDPDALAAIQRQTAGCNGCGDSPPDGL